MSDHAPVSQPVTCLSIDVAKSTETGNMLSPARRFAYQSAIIDLIDQYIGELGFIEYQAKFTGDGWLIFSPHNDDIDKLVVLGKTVCHLYPEFVRDLISGIDTIEPAVRACICSGQDFPKLVKQQDGSAIKDWLGDSARRSSSLASCAYAHELLVDQPVNDRIELIFKSERVDKASLPENMRPKHDKDRPVWKVGELKHAEMDPGDGAAPYISYLSWIGQEQESAKLITAAINAVLKTRQARPANVVRPAVPGALEAQQAEQIDTLRKLLRAAPDSETAGFATQRLTELGAPPDADLFNTMIEKAPNYATAARRYADMSKAGIRPIANSYNLMISKSPDYGTAARWHNQMKQAGAERDVATFTTLIKKAPDHATATRWFQEMTRSGVAANADAFNHMISTAPDIATAKLWQAERAKSGFGGGR